MPKFLDEMPEPTKPSRGGKGGKAGGMPIPQIRVLRALADTPHALTRGEISQLTGNKTEVMVGRALGYSDPNKRAAFEQTKDGGFTESLLTLCYVDEIRLEIEEGIFETRYRITPAGRKALSDLGDIKLPPVKD